VTDQQLDANNLAATFQFQSICKHARADRLSPSRRRSQATTEIYNLSLTRESRRARTTDRICSHANKNVGIWCSRRRAPTMTLILLLAFDCSWFASNHKATSDIWNFVEPDIFIPMLSIKINKMVYISYLLVISYSTLLWQPMTLIHWKVLPVYKQSRFYRFDERMFCV